jgi:hypothetical protein
VAHDAHLMTDDHPGYGGLKKDFKHSVIRHSWKVYARKEWDVPISTNTIEGYFSILKRGINGVYHHVGKHHLHSYLSEFDFRYNSRDVKDGKRSLLAISKVTGKRLKYWDSSGSYSGFMKLFQFHDLKPYRFSRGVLGLKRSCSTCCRSKHKRVS